MWAADIELAKAVANELAKLLRPQERKYDAYEPEPFKPEKPRRNETQLETWQRKIRDDVRSGRAISMNALIREARASQPKPPRAPGTQQQRTNGRWTWWR